MFNFAPVGGRTTPFSVIITVCTTLIRLNVPNTLVMVALIIPPKIAVDGQMRCRPCYRRSAWWVTAILSSTRLGHQCRPYVGGVHQASAAVGEDRTEPLIRHH